MSSHIVLIFWLKQLNPTPHPQSYFIQKCWTILSLQNPTYQKSSFEFSAAITFCSLILSEKQTPTDWAPSLSPPNSGRTTAETRLKIQIYHGQDGQTDRCHSKSCCEEQHIFFPRQHWDSDLQCLASLMAKCFRIICSLCDSECDDCKSQLHRQRLIKYNQYESAWAQTELTITIIIQ